MSVDTQTLSQQLANFVVDTRFEQLSPHTVSQARFALLDQLGVSLAASRLGEGCQAFTAWAQAQQASPLATLWSNGQKTSPALAAFANGALSHALDFEDAHDQALVHPNAASVPAALAVAQARPGTRGEELITAIVVGCDVVCRMGLALQVALDDYGWYPPPILSAFGATAAVAKLHGLNQRQVLDAFSLTLLQATCSAEIKYNPHSHIRAVRDAYPAQTGVQATELAAQGVTGFDQPLEGKAGFFQLFARGHYQPSTILGGLGETFEIDNLSFKPWPSCRGTHAFIDAALSLRAESHFSAADIVRIEAHGHRLNRMLAEPLVEKQQPSTAIDAKFSIPFCVAAVLLKGELHLEQFTPAQRKASDVLSLAKKVRFIVDESLDSPKQMTEGRLTIHLKDGRVMSRFIQQPYGCPSNPLSEKDRLKKFTTCCQSAGLSAHRVQRLAEAILSLEQIGDLQQVFFTYLQE